LKFETPGTKPLQDWLESTPRQDAALGRLDQEDLSLEDVETEGTMDLEDLGASSEALESEARQAASDALQPSSQEWTPTQDWTSVNPPLVWEEDLLNDLESQDRTLAELLMANNIWTMSRYVVCPLHASQSFQVTHMCTQ
jgi:hypothetical protein